MSRARLWCSMLRRSAIAGSAFLICIPQAPRRRAARAPCPSRRSDSRPGRRRGRPRWGGRELPPHDHRILEEDDAELLQQAEEALTREVLEVSLILALTVVRSCACLRVRVEPRQPLVDEGPDGPLRAIAGAAPPLGAGRSCPAWTG